MSGAADNGDLYIERLMRRLTSDRDRACLRHDGCDIGADEFLLRIWRYARALGEFGIGRGDIVALMAPNHPDALAIRYAANLIGAGTIFLSCPSAPEDRAALVRTIAPRLLVVFPETCALIPADVVMSLAGVGMTPPNGARLDAIAHCQSQEPVPSRARAEDLAVIVSSGGSTGVPKGSRRDFAAYTASVSAPSPADRRQLINGPLAHLSQLLADITLLGGGTVVLRDRYEAVDTLAAIAEERITDLFLVEPQLFDLMDHPALPSADLSSLRTLTHIGASAPPSLRLRARRRLGRRIVHTYGASEEGLVSVLTAIEDDPAHPDHFHSAGRILPNVEVRMRRADGTLAQPGEIGSIEVRSPAMAQGYHNRPDLETAAFRNGWYCSGDLGRVDDDGYLHIFGRAVDVETVHGRMVSPTLIEDVLCRLPEIRYAVVVVNRERKCREAAVIPWSGMAVNHQACRDAVANEFGDVVASSLLFLSLTAIPLTAQGKPDREAIHAMSAAEGS
jgi:fatty-acyl-CoA synthase